MSASKITGGVFAPIVSPFDSQERLDVGAFKAIVEYLVAGGVSGLLVAGTTGEAYTLDLDERRKLFQAAVQQAAGRCIILGGAGAITTRQAIEFTHLAADCGCDAACVLTPWFQQPRPSELESYYGDLAEVARLPLLFYHNPPRTGLNWPVEHIAKLAHKLFGPVIGIKESSHDIERVKALRATVPPGFLIFSGNAHQQPKFRPAGSNGAIDAGVNALPQEAVRAAAGEESVIKSYGEVLAALVKSGNLIAAVKKLMSALGLPAGQARRPFHTVDPDAIAAVLKAASLGGRMSAGPADSSPAAAASAGPAVHIADKAALANARPAKTMQTTTIYQATENDFHYSHHASIALFANRFFAAWSNGPLNEDSPGQVIRFAVSDDGRTWSAPQAATPELPSPARWTNGGLWVRGDRLYLLATRYSRARYVEGELTPGVCWEDMATDAFVWQDGTWQPAGLALDDFYSNQAPQPLPGGDGRWLWTGVDSVHNAVLAIGGGAGINDWQRIVVAPRSDGWKLTEPSWFVDSDGTIRVLLRDDGGSRRLFIVESRDGGRSWSAPKPTDLPDAQSKFFALPLGGGRVGLVSSPTASDTKRKLLAVATSPDGRLFDRFWVIRHDEQTRARLPGMHKAWGFQYPNAVVAAGRLWVIYSANKEDIELSSIALEELG